MTRHTVEIAEVFERLAHSLEAGVLPHVENHYARLQLRAAREMLLNLGTRVEWRQRDIESGERASRVALEDLREMPLRQDGEVADLASLRGHLAHVIEGIYDADRDEAERQRALAVIWRVIREEFDADAQLTRTGMFGRPEQAAQPSPGK